MPLPLEICLEQIVKVKIILIGASTGYNSVGAYCIAIGNESAVESPGEGSINFGSFAAKTAASGVKSINIGYETSYKGSSVDSINIGKGVAYEAGTSGNDSSISIGVESGYYGAGERGINIGYHTGYRNQAKSCIAIGSYAGLSGQSENSISIGVAAGQSYHKIMYGNWY